MNETPIGDVIENFARDIIEEASGVDENGKPVPLAMKLDTFRTLTTYFVGINKVGAVKKPQDGMKTMAEMMAEIETAGKGT